MAAKINFTITAEQKEWLRDQIRTQVYGPPISTNDLAGALKRMDADYLPHDLDREQIRKDVYNAWCGYQDYKRAFSKGGRREMIRYTLNVRKTAGALSDCLNKDNWPANFFRHQKTFDEFDLTTFRIRLQRLSEIAAVTNKIYSGKLARSALNPTHWFIVGGLLPVFEKHFPGRRRGRAFKQFAIAISDIFEVHLSEASISKGLTIGSPRKARPNRTAWERDELGILSRKVENS
jgi:hypothetical protein